MSSKFKMPLRDIENWVAGAAAAPSETPTQTAAQSHSRMARLTIDLPQDLHAQFKAACALKRTRMIDQVRGFIEEWTASNR